MFWISILLLAASVPLLLAFLNKLASFHAGDAEPEIEWVAFDRTTANAELPRTALSRFQEKSLEFKQSRLEQLGILKVRHRMLTMYDCYFCNDDCTTVVDVSCVYMFGFFVTASVATKSLLSDGTIVETSSHRQLPNEIAGMANERYFELNCAGTEDIAELLESHRQMMQSVTRKGSGRAVIQLDQDMVAEAVIYGLNLADRYLYKEGVLAEPPRPLFADENAVGSPA